MGGYKIVTTKKIMNKAKTIAVLGTGSDVGKSIIATALCRIFANKGFKVAPFKAQNMSNNSGVTVEGLEMGRAQIVQAEAAKALPHVDMNPVLLKPTSQVGSQLVLLGKVENNYSASQYYKQKDRLFSECCMALDRLRKNYEIVVIEGAGSCAEVNLMSLDIVNFNMAQYADAKVVLVADIHRGGVFAQIIGTLQCISTSQKKRTAGFIINKFKGDISLFKDGAKWIEEKTKKPLFGILPWKEMQIDDEDSVVLDNPKITINNDENISNIAVIRVPHISNFTDFKPLSSQKGIKLYFLEKVQDISNFKAIILPGSKNTRSDLQWLHDSCWSKEILSYADKGGNILGICGGYQMLGKKVYDKEGLEGPCGNTNGLSLLPVITVLKMPKTTKRIKFLWDEKEGIGYEIHIGETKLEGDMPLFKILEQNQNEISFYDGCVTKDFKIMGTYIHGIFDMPEILEKWLNMLGLKNIEVANIFGPLKRDYEYELLAEHFEKHIDINKLIEKCGL